MKELSAWCTNLGLVKVHTYIQSGNIVFERGGSANLNSGLSGIFA
jgi:uncharacterized protein (DUF1697 family)